MQVDVVVIGAGIHGVGVAQAVAAAGYSVVILEKNAPASGTSSKSSKLIHGGLRYLESGQLNLVRECLYERHLLLQNAPDLVQLKPFYIPIYNNTSRGKWKIRTGLSLYYLLSGLKKSGQFKSLHKAQWSQLDGLNTAGLLSVMQYWDAQTNDEFLTKAVLHSAQSLGAELLCPAKVVAGEKRKNQWELHYENESEIRSIQTSVVVNATGPWVNEVLLSINAHAKTVEVDLVQGTHVIVAEKTLKGIYYLEAPSDQRAVFVMPWGEETMIGTTEKSFAGTPDRVQASDEEIDYLLQTSSAYFSKFAQYSKETISHAFAGLRVLPAGTGGAFSKARDTMIFEDQINNPALFTLYGGKLTAYRATAAQVLQQIKPYLPVHKARADTRRLKLSFP